MIMLISTLIHMLQCFYFQFNWQIYTHHRIDWIFIGRKSYQFYQMSTKTQTKTTTTASWESKIKFTNIVQVSLVQSTLEANFRAILEALSQHDHDIAQNKSDTKDNHDHIDSLSGQNQRMEQQLNSLKQQMAKITKDNQIMKSRIEQSEISSASAKAEAIKLTINSPNPESSHQISSSALDSLTKQLNLVKQKTTKLDADTKKNNQQVRADIESLKKQLTEVRKSSDFSLKIKQLEKAIKQLENKNKQINSKIQNIEGEIKSKDQNEGEHQDINQIFKQLSDKLSQFIEGQYKSTNQKHEARLTELQKLAQESKSSIQEEKRLRAKLNQQIWKVHESVSKMSDNKLTEEITSDMLKQIKRQISDLNKKINDLMSRKGTLDSTLHESPSKFKVSDNQSPSKVQGSKQNEDLREEMLDRLKQLKADLLKHMRKMDNKNQGDLVVDKRRLDAIDDAIMRLDHILSEKANVDQVKKLIENVENKISYIYNIFMNESEEDACVARKNWVCLSCDKKLDKFQGKVGTHLVSAQLKAKTLEQDIVGGGMTLRPSKSKYDLPNVYKQGLKKM